MKVADILVELRKRNARLPNYALKGMIEFVESKSPRCEYFATYYNNFNKKGTPAWQRKQARLKSKQKNKSSTK